MNTADRHIIFSNIFHALSKKVWAKYSEDIYMKNKMHYISAYNALNI